MGKNTRLYGRSCCVPKKHGDLYNAVMFRGIDDNVITITLAFGGLDPTQHRLRRFNAAPAASIE